MEKLIKIKMLSKSDIVKGQGVSSAFHEQVDLVKHSDRLKIRVNERFDEADIVHYHTVNPGNYFKMFSKKYKHVAYVHVLAEKLEGSIKLSRPAYWVFKTYTHAFYKKADYLVVVNPEIISNLLDYGIDRDKIEYIPNFVDEKMFYRLSDEKKAAYRIKYNIKLDQFVVLSVGQVLKGKGVFDFIEVAKQMPDVTFVWAGGFSFGIMSEDYRELKDYYENPPANVIFLGIIDREVINEVYNVADILFMPSFNEMFPMTILEAISANKPLVLRNLDLYHDILFNKYNSGENIEDFVREIRKLKEDQDHFKNSERLSKDLSDHYSKSYVLKLWENFYQKVYKD